MEEWITRRQLFCGAGWKGLVASAAHALREATALQERAEPQRGERRDAADSEPSGAASDLDWYFASPLTSYPLLQEMPMDMLLAEARSRGISTQLRGRFIIDPDGVIQAMEVLTPPVGRKFAESVRQIQAYQHVRASGGKEATPAGWMPGEITLTPGPDLVGNVWKVWKPTMEK